MPSQPLDQPSDQPLDQSSDQQSDQPLYIPMTVTETPLDKKSIIKWNNKFISEKEIVIDGFTPDNEPEKELFLRCVEGVWILSMYITDGKLDKIMLLNSNNIGNGDELILVAFCKMHDKIFINMVPSNKTLYKLGRPKINDNYCPFNIAGYSVELMHTLCYSDNECAFLPSSIEILTDIQSGAVLVQQNNDGLVVRIIIDIKL